MKKISLFLLGLLILTNCSDDDGNNVILPTEINPSNYLYFISGKINGEDFVYGQLAQATVLDYSQPGFGNSITSNCAFNPTNGGVNYSSGVYPNLDSEARPSMYFDFVRFYLCDANFDNNAGETFNDAFPVGSYNTAVSNDHNTGTTGAVGLLYRPDSTDNMLFYSSLGDNQSGNSFEITSSTNENISVGAQTLEIIQRIEGTFSFTVYNTEDPTDIIEITDGVFKLFVTFD